jgi:hypothetical protein
MPGHLNTLYKLQMLLRLEWLIYGLLNDDDRNLDCVVSNDTTMI